MKGLLFRGSKWPHPRLCKPGCTMCWESAALGRLGGSTLCILSFCITYISRGFGIAFMKSYLFVKLTLQGCSGAGFHFTGITRSLEMARAPFPSNRHCDVLARQNASYHILGHKTKMTPVDISCSGSLESGRFNLWFEFSLVQYQGLLKLLNLSQANAYQQM